MFLRGLRRRVLTGAVWQRCGVHFNRNILARVGKTHGEMVTATIRTIFAQPDGPAARAQLRTVADTLAGRFPAIADALLEAEDDLLAFSGFPKPHWRRIWSTNPLERVNKELKRRANVVRIFPDDAAVLRLLGAVLIEVHDEWQVTDRRYFSRRVHEAAHHSTTPGGDTRAPGGVTCRHTTERHTPTSTT